MDLTACLSNAKRIGMTGHVNPDGDATSAVLALNRYININYPEIKTDVYLERVNPEFCFLAGSDKVKTDPVPGVIYDLFVVLDCASIDRIKPFASCFDDAVKTVCIDHHVSNDGSFADENKIIPDASSTCEVLYGLLDKKRIDKEIAECLYTGIIHDTGVFKYPSTSPLTMSVASDLISYGFDFTAIIDDSFYSRTFNESKALALALEKSELFLDGYGIYSILTPEDLKELNVTAQELSGIVPQLKLTKGVEIAAFIYPGDGAKKVSLRSKDEIDVSMIAKANGGGGHIRAAGYSSYKGYKEIIDEIIEYSSTHRSGGDC